MAAPKKGLVHVYTGEGKGKTTAALGLTVRAAGHGLPVPLREIVISHRFVACVQKPAQASAADIPGSTRNENSHFACGPFFSVFPISEECRRFSISTPRLPTDHQR